MATTTELANLIQRLELVVNRLEKSGSGGGGDQGEVAQFVEDFDLFIQDAVNPYVAASAALGGCINDQAKLLKEICEEQKKFLAVAAKCSEPKDASVLGKLTAAMGDKMAAMDKFKGLRSMKIEEKNHVYAACEGVVVFGWVRYPKTPMKHVEESKESAKFYTNKVLTAFKNGDKAEEHKAWVKSFLNIFDSLHSYIKEHHRTGLSWNKSGPAATEGSATGVPPPPPGPIPPPPPPAALSTTQAASKPSTAPPSVSPMSQLFGELNKGTEITKGLKKVTNDMKTHKNPDLRKHTPIPFKPKPAPSYKPVTAAKPAVKKPPKLQLEGKKWIVEYQDNATDLLIDNTQMKQTVYIYKCIKSTITIKGKVNSIVLDGCKKMGVVFESVVSGVEIINCESIKVQAQGKMPTASIDKTDGCIIYLNKECLDCPIVCAKSSEMNVSVPRDDDSGEFDEFPLCEQFRMTYNRATKKIDTVPTESI